MTRKKKLLLNTVSGFAKQIIVMICGFILPRYMLLYYGSEINGLVSSITHFLGFITLLEMGVGPVIQANLYKPLAKKDTVEISKIIKASEKFFRTIAYIFLAYIVALSILFPVFINSEFDAAFSVSLLIIIAISTFAQYYFGMTYQLLLNADQLAYVQISLQIITVILNTALCIVLMKLGASIHVVKLATAIVYIIRPLGQMLYVQKHYDIDKKIKLTEEPIKQKWNGFSQHLAAVVCGNIDVVVLTLFSSLSNVSIYSVYFNVTNGVTNVIMTAATGLESLFGNMIANGEKETLNNTFETVEFIVHFAVTVVFTIAAITIVPFVKVYTRGITDADYIAPLFSAILVTAYAAQCLRVPYFRVIKAAGHFKETQNGAFISTALNIIVSVSLVFKFGLIGIALGTFIAMFYHTCYFVVYLRKNILNRSARHYLYLIFLDVIIAVVSSFASRLISPPSVTYGSWFIYAIEISFITLGISLCIQFIANRKKMQKLWIAFAGRLKSNPNRRGT